MTSGSIALACEAVDGRSRLRTVHYAGLSRVSRGFPRPRGGLRVVASTLGPGILGGDTYVCEGSVAAGARFELCGQMATPVLGGSSPSQTHARWRVESDATLTVVAQPLMMGADARHDAQTDVAVADSGCAIVAETVCMRSGTSLTMRTSATIDGRLALCDALEIVRGDDGRAFGTVAIVCADDARRAAVRGLVRAHLSAETNDVRSGYGETGTALVVRLSGPTVWNVAQSVAALARLAATVAATASPARTQTSSKSITASCD